MQTAELLPYVFGGGGITIIIAALRWGRQDARDSVDAAASNTDVALKLRNEAMTRIAELEAENRRLHEVCRKHGIDRGEWS